MPNTPAWDELFEVAHDWVADLNETSYAAIDNTTVSFAETLGVTLDRPTLESALWCISNIVGLAWMFEAGERGTEVVMAEDDGAEPSEANQCLALKIMRYIVVKRLELEMLADA